VYGATQKEARDKLRRLVETSEIGVDPTDKATVGAFLEYWRSAVVPSRPGRNGAPLTEKTLDSYDYTLSLISARIGTRRLVDLVPEDVDQLLADLAREGYARNVILRVRSYLTAALDHALARRRVTWNAARLAVMPVTEPPRKGRALTAGEFAAFQGAADQDRLGAMFLLALATGARPGEYIALEWSRLNLDAGTMTIQASMKRVKNRPQLGDVKHATAGERTIGLPSWAIAALRSHRVRQSEERLKAGPTWSSDWPDLVFTTTVGTPVDPRRINRRNLHRICESAGIEGNVNPYDTRHTVASQLLDNGVPIEKVADVLGNSPLTVARYYRHSVRSVQDANVNVMEELGGQPPTTPSPSGGHGGGRRPATSRSLRTVGA
jgi:integrase